MPMSVDAFAGLQAMVEWNPFGARFLLGILRERPAWVRYKDDPYGPLHLIQHVDEPMRVSADGRLVAEARTPFPAERFAACERFGHGWRCRDIGRSELADALARALAALPGEVVEDDG